MEGVTIKRPSLDFPRFAGGNPSCWITTARCFFDYYGTKEDFRLLISRFHMDGEALRWFREMNHTTPFTTWFSFTEALEAQFGTSEYEMEQSQAEPKVALVSVGDNSALLAEETVQPTTQIDEVCLVSNVSNGDSSNDVTVVDRAVCFEDGRKLDLADGQSVWEIAKPNTEFARKKHLNRVIVKMSYCTQSCTVVGIRRFNRKTKWCHGPDNRSYFVREVGWTMNLPTKPSWLNARTMIRRGRRWHLWQHWKGRWLRSESTMKITRFPLSTFVVGSRTLKILFFKMRYQYSRPPLVRKNARLKSFQIFDPGGRPQPSISDSEVFEEMPQQDNWSFSLFLMTSCVAMDSTCLHLLAQGSHLTWLFLVNISFFAAIGWMFTTKTICAIVEESKILGCKVGSLTHVFCVYTTSTLNVHHHWPNNASQLNAKDDLDNDLVPRYLDKATMVFPSQTLREQEKNKWRLYRVTKAEETQFTTRLVPWPFIIVGNTHTLEQGFQIYHMMSSSLGKRESKEKCAVPVGVILPIFCFIAAAKVELSLLEAMHGLARTKVKCLLCSQTLVKHIDHYRKLEGHGGVVNLVQFNYVCGALVSSSNDKQIICWKWAVNTKEFSYSFGHLANMFQARIMHFIDGREIITSSSHGQLFECTNATEEYINIQLDNSQIQLLQLGLFSSVDCTSHLDRFFKFFYLAVLMGAIVAFIMLVYIQMKLEWASAFVSLTTATGVSTMAFDYPRALIFFTLGDVTSKDPYLDEFGPSNADVGWLMAFNPRLMACHIEERWKTLVKYLHYVRICQDGMRKILSMKPIVFYVNLDTTIAPKAQVLQDIGTYEEAVRSMLVGFPPLLMSSLFKTIWPVIIFWITQAEVATRALGKVITFGLEFVGCTVTNKLEVTVVTFFSLSMLIADFSILLRYSLNVFTPKYSYLTRTMGQSLQDLIDIQNFFSYSFDGRILEAHRILVECLLYLALCYVLASTNGEFSPILAAVLQRFVQMIVDLMKLDKLLFWQGGSIVIMQIENGYRNIVRPYGEERKKYATWTASMAPGVGASIDDLQARVGIG